MSDFKLNKEQEKAVSFGDEPLIIIAGAGTGKTRVITERIVWLIDQGKAKPSEILALTFTEKTANEMQERIDIALPLGYSEVFVSTFHSFCDQVLKQDGIHIGLNPSYKLMNQSEAYYFVLRRLFEFDLKYFRPLSNPTKFVGELLKHFSRLQDEDISPGTYEKFAGKISKTEEGKEKYPHILELAGAYKKYVELKLKESMFDFGDLIANTLKLFRERPNVLKIWKQKFKYILVDEFQDTNYAQYEIVKLLAGGDDNSGNKKSNGGSTSTPIVTVVADDDQSIYRFRGAAVSNVLQFRKDFPDARNVVLTENYRSDQKILDASYGVIQKNNPDRLEVKEKINKKLIATKESKNSIKDPVQFNYFLKAQDEAEWIAEEILKITGGKSKAERQSRDENSDLPIFNNSSESAKGSSSKARFLYSDIAVLVRANDHSDEIIQALRYHGIPYQFGGVRKLFLRPEVKDMINILKILVDYSDDVSMFGLLGFEIMDLEAEELIEINRQAKQATESIFKILENSSELSISENSKEKIKKLVEHIKKGWGRIKDGKNTGEILLGFIKESGYLEALTETGKKQDAKKVVRQSTEAENEVRVQNIARFFDFIQGFENTNKEDGIAEINKFVEYLELVTDLGDSPYSDIDLPDFDAVHIITVHSAKGLEFPVVFLPCLVQGRFPSLNRKDQIPIPEELIKEILPEGDEHIQEERRLFYVGMTRAEERLYVTSAQHYGAGKRKQKVSPFVVEAFGEDEVLKKLAAPHSYDRNILLEKEGAETPETELIKLNPLKNLSYSQIETYEKCPKQYKYKFVLKVPTPQSPTLTFGSVIHAVLKDFYEIVKKSQQGFEGFGKIPELEDLKKIFEEKWNGMAGASMGAFKSKTYRDKMHRRGLDALESFYKKLYSESDTPFMLEQSFNLRVGDYTLRGKIDRVDIVTLGDTKSEAKVEKQTVRIVDYKTGQVREQKEVDKDLQLAIYAMAAREVFKLEPESLSLMFVDEGLRVETSGEGMKGLEKKVEEKVEKVGGGIESGKFGATPGFICKYCEFRDICEDAV